MAEGALGMGGGHQGLGGFALHARQAGFEGDRQRKPPATRGRAHFGGDRAFCGDRRMAWLRRARIALQERGGIGAGEQLFGIVAMAAPAQSAGGSSQA
jgi:hypothetical protein